MIPEADLHDFVDMIIVNNTNDTDLLNTSNTSSIRVFKSCARWYHKACR